MPYCVRRGISLAIISSIFIGESGIVHASRAVVGRSAAPTTNAVLAPAGLANLSLSLNNDGLQAAPGLLGSSLPTLEMVDLNTAIQGPVGIAAVQRTAAVKRMVAPVVGARVAAAKTKTVSVTLRNKRRQAVAKKVAAVERRFSRGSHQVTSSGFFDAAAFKKKSAGVLIAPIAVTRSSLRPALFNAADKTKDEVVPAAVTRPDPHGSKKVVMASLIGNFLVAVVKFFAAAVTGSAAMTSEGIHSIVDTGNQVLILYGLRQAAKPPSKEYPFGRGRELYFWSFVVAISIFAIGALVSLGEGVHRLMEPSVITNPMVNYIVLALAMVFEGYAWKVAYNKFRQSMGKKGFMKALRDHKDPAVFLVLFEDSAALVGLAIAALGIALTQATGILYFDGIAALLIGVVLAITAFFLARETKSLLIGESADPEIVQGIKELAMTFRSVESVNDVLTMQLGANDVLVNLSIEFRDEESTGTLEATIAALVKAIKARFPDVKRVFVEAADHK